jgi:hypothetical protein
MTVAPTIGDHLDAAGSGDRNSIRRQPCPKLEIRFTRKQHSTLPRKT